MLSVYVFPCSRIFPTELRLQQTFKDATEFFSRADTNVSAVIEAMDEIDVKLDSFPEYSAAIQDVLAMGKLTLNKYYGKTDSSQLYRIAMSK